MKSFFARHRCNVICRPWWALSTMAYRARAFNCDGEPRGSWNATLPEYHVWQLLSLVTEALTLDNMTLLGGVSPLALGYYFNRSLDSVTVANGLQNITRHRLSLQCARAGKHLGRGVGSAHRTLEGVSEYSGDAATPTCLIEPFTTGFKQFNSNTGWTANLDA